MLPHTLMVPDGYSVRMTTCARHQYNELSSDLRELALRQLVGVAGLAAQMRPPSPQMLRDAHIEPPVLRLNAWPLVILYETDPDRHTLTALHFLRAGRVESHHEAPAFG